MPTLRPRKPKSGPPSAAATASSSASETVAEPPASSVSSAVPSPTPSAARQRRTQRGTIGDEKRQADQDEMAPLDEESPLLPAGSAASDAGTQPSSSSTPETLSWAQRNQWILFALASGACAAFNGVFAKLTTTELTTRLSASISRLLGLGSSENLVELLVRGSFFGLNLTFNGVMWTLFTTALARGHSTTQVSIMNTSANFVLTALLGSAIFSEALPPLWWLGAAMLVAGNVIIGRKDEGQPSHEGEKGMTNQHVGADANSVSPSGIQEKGGASRAGKAGLGERG